MLSGQVVATFQLLFRLQKFSLSVSLAGGSANTLNFRMSVPAEMVQQLDPTSQDPRPLAFALSKANPKLKRVYTFCLQGLVKIICIGYSF